MIEYAAEATPLVHAFKAIQQGRRRAPQPLGEVFPQVFARLGIAPVQSTVSGEARSHAAPSGPRAENAFASQRGDPSPKLGALSDHQRLIRQCGVTPLTSQYGETVIKHTREKAPSSPERPPDPIRKKPPLEGPGRICANTPHPIPTWRSGMPKTPGLESVSACKRRENPPVTRSKGKTYRT